MRSLVPPLLTGTMVFIPLAIALGLWQTNVTQDPLYFIGLQGIGWIGLVAILMQGNQQFHAALKSLHQLVDCVVQRQAPPRSGLSDSNPLAPLNQLALALENACHTQLDAPSVHNILDHPVLRDILDHLSTNVMLADEHNIICYINPATLKTFSALESDLNVQLGNFQARKLVGQSIDRFHRRPEHQRQIVSQLRGVHRARVALGKCTFEIIARPLNDQGRRIGTVVEWADRTFKETLEKALENTTHLSRSAQGNVESATSADKLAKDATVKANEGVKVLSEAAKTMESISRSSRQVAAITEKIDSIALRTKLLALNAAVEAARTGEHGRGFAVVAGEVGALAQQSAQAAKEIRNIVSESLKLMRDGGQWVTTSSEVLDRILGAVQQVSSTMGSIAHDSEQQLSGIAEVHDVIDKVSDLLT